MADCKECDKCGRIVAPSEIFFLCLHAPGIKKEIKRKEYCRICAEEVFGELPMSTSDPDDENDQD